MFKKLFGNILLNIGYVPREEYNAAIYDNVKLQQELAIVVKKSEDLQRVNDHLPELCRYLNDENKSLWDMLDELQGSSTFGKDQMKSMMTELEEVLTDEMLRNFKPIGDT